MSIELNLPYTIKEIKKAFEHGDKAIGFLKTSNCMCYLTGAYELVEALKKDGRLDPGIVKDLEVLDARVATMTFVLRSLAQTK